MLIFVNQPNYFIKDPYEMVSPSHIRIHMKILERGNKTNKNELRMINKPHNVLSLYTYFLLSLAKIVEKTTIRSEVTKKYDKPKTPYGRITESDKIPYKPQIPSLS